MTAISAATSIATVTFVAALTMTTITAALTTTSSTVMIGATTTMARKEKEEDKGGKMKNFHFSKSKEVFFPFSKPKGVISESANKFFLGKKEDDPGLL